MDWSICLCAPHPSSHLSRVVLGCGMVAAGGTVTGLSWFCGCMATCFSMLICCCCYHRWSIWLLVNACPCFCLIPVSKVLKEHSISCNSGDVVCEELVEVVVSGLEAFEDSWLELPLEEVSDEELSVPLVLVLSEHKLPVDGELGKDTEDSIVVVSESGCKLAGWESLGVSCGSLESVECLLDTPVWAVLLEWPQYCSLGHPQTWSSWLVCSAGLSVKMSVFII